MFFSSSSENEELTAAINKVAKQLHSLEVNRFDVEIAARTLACIFDVNFGEAGVKTVAAVLIYEMGKLAGAANV